MVSFFLTAGRGLRSQTPASAECRAPSWSAARALSLPDGRPVYVEAPVPAPYAGGLALLGTPTLVWQTPTVFADTAALGAPLASPDSLAGVWVDGRGVARLVTRPPGARRFMAPRAVPRGDGTLDVFWGEAPDSVRAESRWVRSLWHARFGAAGWSAPRQLLGSGIIGWNNAYPVVASVGGQPWVIVPVWPMTNSDTSGVVIVRRDASEWAVVRLPDGPIAPLNVALTSLGDSRLVLAVLGRIRQRGAGRSRNGVFTATSADGGHSWKAGPPLGDFGEDGTNALQLVRTGDGRLHLFWEVDRLVDGHEHVESVQRAVSADDGATWRVLPPMRDEPFRDAYLATAHGDRVLLVAHGHADARLAVAEYAGDEPPRFVPLAFAPAEIAPRMGVLRGDTLVLVWGVRRQGVYPLFPSYPAPQLVLATAALACARMP